MEILIIVAVLIGLIPAYIAKKKGRSFGMWWVYGTLLFVVAIIHVLLIKPDQVGLEIQQLASGMKKCPYCAEFVKEEAILCKHCGNELDEPA